MNPQEIEKIKSLIQTSGILSASEKAEWLALLGLMNDRQLSELEKILNGGVKNKQSAQPLSKSAAAANPLAQPNLPPLSHIVNLPKNFGARPQAPQKPASQGVTPEALAKRILEVKPDKQALSGKESFAARLKNIFCEKELPPGSKTQNLGLSSITAKEKTLPAVPVKPAAAAVKIPPPVIKLPPLVPRPNSQTAGPQPKVLEKILAPALPKKPPVNNLPSNAAVIDRLKAQAELAEYIAPQKPLPPAAVKAPLQNSGPQNSGSAFSAGITFAKPSYKTTEERIAEIKQSSQAKSPRALTEAEAKIGAVQTPVVGLENLDSLMQVSLSNLEKYSLDSLAAKIRLLVKQFGYFDVIFNLEKSPAYKAYIQTGIKLLSDQQDFEQLYNNGQSGNYLSREDFEKFTDLLLKIQIS